MGRPRKNPNVAPTVDRILAAAEIAFSGQSYKGVRLEDVAEHAGIRRPSLLYHFKTKATLFEATVNRAFADLRKAIGTALMQEGTYPELLDLVVSTTLDFQTSRKTSLAMVLRSLLGPAGPQRELAIRNMQELVDLLETFICTRGKLESTPERPIRGTLMHLITGALVRATLSAHEDELWGKEDPTRVIAQKLFVDP